MYCYSKLEIDCNFNGNLTMMAPPFLMPPGAMTLGVRWNCRLAESKVATSVHIISYYIYDTVPCKFCGQNLIYSWIGVY